MPDAAIGADVMAGFPGETEADFEESRRFIEDLPFTYLHVFTYSERPGTPAAADPGFRADARPQGAEPRPAGARRGEEPAISRVDGGADSFRRHPARAGRRAQRAITSTWRWPGLASPTGWWISRSAPSAARASRKSAQRAGGHSRLHETGGPPAALSRRGAAARRPKAGWPWGQSCLRTGNSRIRFPVAAKMALQMAGAMGGTPGSPTARRRRVARDDVYVGFPARASSMRATL